MSLSRLNYTLSFFLYQVILSVWNGVVIGAILWNNVVVFSDPVSRSQNSLYYAILMTVFCIGMVGYSMALSTLFYDTKVA